MWFSPFHCRHLAPIFAMTRPKRHLASEVSKYPDSPPGQVKVAGALEIDVSKPGTTDGKTLAEALQALHQ